MAGNSILLKTGAKMPIVGLGTWMSKPAEVRAAVEVAIDAGYRHFDCAYDYANESKIGEAIQAKIKDGKVKREDLFITTKLWLTFYSPNHVQEYCKKSLNMLKLNHVDLYLMHFPFALKFTSPEDVYPEDEKGNTLFDETIDYVDVWREMIKLQNNGLAKSIGVSNFNEYQLKRLIKETDVVPDVHQFEIHPYISQEDLIKFCQSHGIAVTGYSPLGSPAREEAQSGDPVLFEEQTLKSIGEKYGKTVAQILLRYQIQRDVVVIPKSVTPSRIINNIDIFDFVLSDEDCDAIRNLDRNRRFCDYLSCAKHKYYPFRENYSESIK